MAKYLDYEGLKKLITKLGKFISTQVTSQIENQSPQVYAISEDEVNDLFPNTGSTETIRYQTPGLDSYYYNGYARQEICTHRFSIPLTTTSKIQVMDKTGTSLAEIDCSTLTWQPVTDWNSNDTSGKNFTTVWNEYTDDTYGEYYIYLLIGASLNTPNDDDSAIDFEGGNAVGDNSIYVEFDLDQDIETEEEYLEKFNAMAQKLYPLSVTVTNS